ncbi:MAG TPA: hypothetical protein V6D05_08695 [Stenomitos sp.]
MAKLILSGDLSIFRIELVIRILEAVKFDGEVAIEALERGQIFMLQGKVVGARTAMDQGLGALAPITTQRAGTFSVRQTTADEVTRHPDLVALPDNASIFRQLAAQAAQTRVSQVTPPHAAPPQMPQPGMPAAAPAAVPAAAPMRPPAAQAAVPPKPKTPVPAGPMGRVPELTDKGKVTIRSIQTNAAMRGVQVEADNWRILGKVDGNSSLFHISGMLNILGDRFTDAVEQLQTEGYIRFQAHDPGLENLQKRTETKFRFGEYMVAKGIITEVQLEAALRRQQDLARRGRYMWLGEILIELNYARPSQVQEALAVQKRMGS